MPKKFRCTGLRILLKWVACPVYACIWCGGMPTNFPMHRFADTFDDVISIAVATGALGSGTAGSALRGGVVA